MLQIFWEFTTSQNKSDNNQQANWESVITQMMEISTCYFFLISYSLSVLHYVTSQTDEEINSLTWISLSSYPSPISSLSLSVSVSVCFSLSLSLLFPPLPFMIHSCISTERGFCSDSSFQTLEACTCWHQHYPIITLSLTHPHSTYVCTPTKSCPCFGITHPLAQVKKEGR